MKTAIAVLLSALVASPLSFAGDEPRMTSPGPYSDMIQQVQAKLGELGFDAGPANGDWGPKTQAALAQFQLAWDLPASGSMDERTLDALGVAAPPSTAAAGGTETGGE